MLDLALILARRIRVFSFITAALTLAAVAAAFLLPPLYTAHSSVLPPQQSGSLGSAILSQMGNLGPLAAAAGGGLGLKNPSDLYVSMLSSRTVADALIKSFDLQRVYDVDRLSDARRQLESRTAIASSPKDGIIRVSVEDRDPKRSADMANAYVQELKKLSETLAVTEASQRRMFFQKQIDEVKVKMTTTEDDFRKLQQKSGLLQLEGQAQALVESAAMLRAQVTAKEVEIQSIGTYATDNNPEMALAKQQLNALKTELSRLTSSSGGPSSDILVSKARLPQAGLDYLRAMRDVKYYETVFELLSKQLELAKLDEARQGGAIQIVDLAITPDRRSFPRRTPMIILGFLAAVCVAGVVSFALERWDSVKRDPDFAAKLASLGRKNGLSERE